MHEVSAPLKHRSAEHHYDPIRFQSEHVPPWNVTL